jgi:iron complex outermembrane receptor protein
MSSAPKSMGPAQGLRRLLLGTATAAAGLAAFAPFASAAAADTNDVSTVKELVVTARHYVPTTNTAATKIEIPLLETPQSITVITRDQIDVLNMQNLAQAVRYTSGIVGENYGSDERYDWLTLRGFNPVEYIDGLQAPVTSVSNVGLDLWGAGSVEILKGPSGVLYGQSPPGGIVNITSRRPEKNFSAELQGQYGSFDDRQVAGDITGSLLGDGVLEGRLTALYRDRDTQTEHVNARRLYIAPALTWNIDQDTRLTFLAYYQYDRINGDGGGFLPYAGTLGSNPYGKLPVDFNAGEPDYNRYDRDQFGYGYDFWHRFDDHFTFKQNLKYSSNHDYFQSVYGAGLEADNQTLDRYIFVYPETTKQIALDSRLEVREDTGPVSHVGLIGVDYRDFNYSTNFGFGFGPTLNIFHPVYGQTIPYVGNSPDTREDQSQVGVYGQDELKYGHWRLTLSAREDWLTTTNVGQPTETNSAFSYRAGLNYVFRSGLSPYIAYSTSFLPQAGTTYGGQPFVPSTGDQIELGVKYEPAFLPKDVKVFTTAAIYDLDQQHVLTNDPNHLFFSIQTGEVEVKGIELESIARIHERLTINASYSYTDAKTVKAEPATSDGTPLPFVSPHKFSLLADYTFQTGALAGLGGGLGMRYLSSSQGDPTNNVGPGANVYNSGDVTLYDALLHYNYEKWRVSVNGSNIFDKIYVQRCTSAADCFYGLRRTVMLTLDRKF